MLLDIRGLTQPEDIQAVLGGEAPLSDPYQMKGMDRAVERIRQAIEGSSASPCMGITTPTA